MGQIGDVYQVEYRKQFIKNDKKGLDDAFKREDWPAVKDYCVIIAKQADAMPRNGYAQLAGELPHVVTTQQVGP